MKCPQCHSDNPDAQDSVGNGILQARRGSMRDRTFLIILISTFLLSMIQCGKGSEKAPADESKITLGLVADDLWFNKERTEIVVHLMFLSFCGVNDHGELEAALAERWEHSDDYKEWTFFLRKDVKWHDGTPTTAHDVKFTFDLVTNPDAGVYSRGNYTVEVIGDYCLMMRYKKPKWSPSFQTFYPKHILEKLNTKEFWRWDFWKQPVGNGPYRCVRYVPGVMTEVEVNPDFYGEKPKIERVVFKLLKEPSLTELLSGNVDALAPAPRDFISKLPKENNFSSYYFWLPVMRTIYWNHKNPFFKDAKIRKALTLAIDKKELAAALNYPEEVPLIDAVINRNQFRKEQYPESIPFDPDEARTLLESAGWKDSDGDGIRERNGKKFQFTAIVREDIDNRIPVYVQSQFQKIGIHMELESLDRKTTFERRELGQFEAIFTVISNSATQSRWGHIKMFGKNAPSGYANPEISTLFDLVIKTRDDEEKDKLYQKIQQILITDVPTTFLVPLVSTSIVHSRIKGLSSPYRSDIFDHLPSLWIEEQKP